MGTEMPQLHGPLPLWKRQHFVLPGVDTYSGYGFAFPAHSASAKTTIHGLQDALSTAMVFHTVSLLTKELTSLQRSGQSAHDHGVYQFYHVPYHPKAPGLIERWNGLLKTKLQSQLADSGLDRRGRVLQKVVYSMNQYPTYGTITPVARIHEYRS